MNRLKARVEKIEAADTLHIVTFLWEGVTIRMVSLNLDAGIVPGKEVMLGVNFSSVAIAKDLGGSVSYTNQVAARIAETEEGELVTVVRMQIGATELAALITTGAFRRMQLKVGDSVTAIIKANDLFLEEVLT
ncbi:MAG TPA: hypothetical protein ENK93_05175 [Campylobacteraceae bacterium]|nr:hypothetical protein [Campylobacteraceae bacterium]